MLIVVTPPQRVAVEYLSLTHQKNAALANSNAARAFAAAALRDVQVLTTAASPDVQQLLLTSKPKMHSTAVAGLMVCAVM
jgi:hypothetical protein